jgi:Skp family chaperone for outer membrane proteins
MTVRNHLIAGLAAGAAVALAPITFAAAQPTPPAAPPLTFGAPIPGFCTFSFSQIMAQSKVGQAVVTRLKQLDAAWQAELQPQADSFNTDKRAFEAQQATMDPAARDARAAALQLRFSNLQKLAAQRQQEMEATQNKQFGVVEAQVEPIIRQLFQARACSVLIQREQAGIGFVNPAMDLSSAAVTGLDAKIQTLTFDREHVEPGATPPAQ